MQAQVECTRQVPCPFSVWRHRNIKHLIGLMCTYRQIESMAASAATQQAANAEAEQRLIERLKTVEAALSEARESEQALSVCPLYNPLRYLRSQASCIHACTVALIFHDCQP